MSTAVLPPPARARGADTRPGLGRLTLVELRKMTDTRAGFWLLLDHRRAHGRRRGHRVPRVPGRGAATCSTSSRSAVQPASILLPIVGILLVSSEWTQRTAMITFALRPAPLAGAGRQAARRAEPRGDRVRALPGHRRWSRRRSPAPTATRPGRCRPALLGQAAFSVARADADRHRVRRRAALLGARDRPVLRAPDRCGGARRDLGARGRGALARPVAHDGADARGDAQLDAVGARRDVAGAVDGRCRSRSGSGASRAATCAEPIPLGA